MVLLPYLALALVSGQDVKPKTFVFAYDTKFVSEEFVSDLKRHASISEVRQVFQQKDFSIQENRDGTVFIFPGFERLRQYIELKKALYQFISSSGAGLHDEKWQKLPTLSQLPIFFQDYVTLCSINSMRVKLGPDHKIDPQLDGTVTLKKGDDEITFVVPLERQRSADLEKIWQGSPVTRSNISQAELNATLKDYENRLDQPSVLYRSDRTTLVSWGTPWANSRYASLVRKYFDQLQQQTEKMENQVKELESAFLKQLGNSDIHWKMLSDASGKAFSGLDKNSQSFLKDALLSNSTLMESGLINTDQKLSSFLSSAQVTRCRVRASIMVPYLSANGSQGSFGVSLP